jgi:TRAP-type C4-dicarboxylate transport system permease small subunit
MKNMKKGNFLVLGLLGLVMVPSVVYGISNLTELVNFFTDFIYSSVIKLIYALITLVFLWGVFEFVKNADNETKRAEGRQFMIWGIIGLFVMISFQGIVMVLQNTFQLPTNNTSTRNSYQVTPADQARSNFQL